MGNPLPIVEDDEDKPSVYSIKYDGDLIYAAFMQTYGMDLLEQQGKLHWRKFNALLAGLSDDTKFAEVIKIRSWTPNGEDKKERSKMRKLQEKYALPDEEGDED